MLAIALVVLSQPVMAQEPVSSPLTLEQAVNQALQSSPVLAASTSRANAATAAMSQASAFPNPEVSVEAENIFGDGPYDGMDAGEITYGISQLIELPGKRSSRVQVADAEKKRIHYSRDGARLNLIRDVIIAYAEVVAAEQQLEILMDEQELAAAVRDSVSAKVKAGKVPPIQKNKAEIELSTSDIALDRAKRQVIAKKNALSSLMGSDLKDIQVSADSLPAMTEPETLEAYKTLLLQSPDLQALEVDIDQAQSQFSLEKANAIPDPTFDIGVRQFREDDSQALVAGVSFPFPVFNLNRAGINRAGHEITAAKLDRQSGQLSIENQLVEAYDDLVSGYRTAKALETTVLPGAEEAFSVARQGYDAGKFEYLEVLDAQRTLFETRKERNAAVLDYYRQKASIERLTAKHFHTSETTKKEK
jgi:cobalt-zinc-cadmium efflux system outer membrane protein